MLALSVGLNAGLLYAHLSERGDRVRGKTPPRIARGIAGRWGPRHHPGGPHGFFHERVCRIGDCLKLTDEQREGMAEAVSESMSRIASERQRIQEIRDAMEEEYRKKEPEFERIRSLVREASEIQALLDSIVAETMLREAALLGVDLLSGEEPDS